MLHAVFVIIFVQYKLYQGTVSNAGSTVQNRLFWSTAHVQDCFIQGIYIKLSPGLISTRTVSNTMAVNYRRHANKGNILLKKSLPS